MRIFRYCFLALLCAATNTYAQLPPSSVHALTIGDTVPDIELSNVINYPVSKIQLSGLKGKLVLLDFWASWCSTCLNSFPELDSLQDEFPDGLRIILINPKISNDDNDKVQKTLSRMKKIPGKPFSLPLTWDDTLASSYFRFRSIPHIVWIGENGVVCAITSKEQVNAINIRAMLAGEKIELPVKVDKPKKTKS